MNMTVTISKPTDEIVGTFELIALENLRPAFATFAASHAVSAYDLVKCGDQTWTILLKNGNFTLQAGIVSPQNTLHSGMPTARVHDDPTHRITQRAADSYERADKTYAVGDLIKLISIVFGILVFLFGLFNVARFGGLGSFLLGTVLGAISFAIVTLPLYAFGALLCAQAKILEATIDTSINTSPFLPNDAKIRALRLQDHSH
jgi:hypothetical protein